MQMQFDYTKLEDRMKEQRLTQKALAQKAGMSESHFAQKLAGEFSFKQNEIEKMCTVLNIAPDEIGIFFFCPKS